MNTDKIYAESIANEYAAKATSKVLSLKKLDAKAKRPSKIFTYTFGIVSALILGIGMCLSMQVIGSGSVLRTAVIFFYISNEGVSLVENAAHLGLPVPDKLKDVLEQLHDRDGKEGQ